MKILEEFWYGNIEPTDYDTSSCKEYKKLQELICRNEEKLRVAMTDEQKAVTNSLKLWIESMKKLGEMKLYIQRYQQIVQTSIDEKCLCSMTAYTEMLIDQINTLWNDFILVEDLVSELIENANEQNSELLNVVKLFFNCYEELETVISTQNDPSELIQIIETVSIIMFLLLPSVS